MRRALLDTWRQERRDRPFAVRLAVLGLAMVAAGAALAGGGVYVLAQLLGGLAVLPLALAAYFRMLPALPWREDGGGNGPGGGPGSGPDDPRGSGPDAGPDADLNWERFEREFRAYAERRPLAHA